MPRIGKQIVYGVGFFIVVAGMLAAVFKPVLTPAPSCTDGRLNQDEEEIDCGGTSCMACAIKRLEPIRTGSVRVFVSGSSTALVAELTNPNAEYGISRIGYSFVVRSPEGVVQTIASGVERLGPGERRTIFAVAPKDLPIGGYRVDIVSDAPNWQIMPGGEVAGVAVDDVATEIAGESVTVSGSVRNQSPLGGDSVRILAIIADRLGNEIFAAQTVSENLGGLESRSWRILFPRDVGIAGRVDPARTRVFGYILPR